MDTPHEQCAICLDIVEDTAKLDGCNHQFCYNCIRAWANLKNECPLCKSKFKIIESISRMLSSQEKKKRRFLLRSPALVSLMDNRQVETPNELLAAWGRRLRRQHHPTPPSSATTETPDSAPDSTRSDSHRITSTHHHSPTISRALVFSEERTDRQLDPHMDASLPTHTRTPDYPNQHATTNIAQRSHVYDLSNTGTSVPGAPSSEVCNTIVTTSYSCSDIVNYTSNSISASEEQSTRMTSGTETRSGHECCRNVAVMRTDGDRNSSIPSDQSNNQSTSVSYGSNSMQLIPPVSASSYTTSHSGTTNTPTSTSVVNNLQYRIGRPSPITPDSILATAVSRTPQLIRRQVAQSSSTLQNTNVSILATPTLLRDSTTNVNRQSSYSFKTPTMNADNAMDQCNQDI